MTLRRKTGRFPVLDGMIADLPAEGWTQERRDHFMRVFGLALDYCIPIKTPSAALGTPGSPSPEPPRPSAESAGPAGSDPAMPFPASRPMSGVSSGAEDQLTEGRT